MDKRISLELRGRKKCEVETLDLSGAKTGGELDGLTDEFETLSDLNLQDSSLTNIKLFPKLPSLTRLDLSLNRLSKGLEVLTESKQLKFLTLSDNKFKDLECFESLKGLESLTHLDISGNDFELEASDLKLKIFELLPQLEFLDGEDKDGNEVKSEDNDDEEDSDEDDEDSEEDEEEDSDDEEDGPGLSALYDNTALLDEDDEDDFDAAGAEGGEDEDEDIDDEEEDDDENAESKGKKRKIDEAE